MGKREVGRRAVKRSEGKDKDNHSEPSISRDREIWYSIKNRKGREIDRDAGRERGEGGKGGRCRTI